MYGIKMKINKILILVLLIVVRTITVQADDKFDKKAILLNLAEPITWGLIQQQKIVFVYRSFGRNILEGIKELGIKYNQSEFVFIKPDTMAGLLKYSSGFFMQQWIEMNSSPQEIKEEYEHLLERIQLKDIDFAMVRFTPFFGNNNVEENFKQVRMVIEDLRKVYPDTLFIIPTFPLTYSKTTWRTQLKKFIGKDEIWEYDSNITINEFNRHMRNKYSSNVAFFDLAKIQSTYSNGKRSTFTKNGKSYFHMVSEYTHDGTHLSVKGREIVAEQFLSLIGKLALQTNNRKK